MTAIDDLAAWCTKRLADLQQGLQMMEDGVLRTSEQQAGGVSTDTTADTIATYVQQIEELRAVLAQIDRDWPDRLK